MRTYRVAFDGKWQARFRNRGEALQWARAVSETGRLVHVVRSGSIRSKLVAVFPENQTEEGQRLWKIRSHGPGGQEAGPGFGL
jgi:hypothetical protein